MKLNDPALIIRLHTEIVLALTLYTYLLPEYGILYGQTCVKYILDETNEMDRHYFNVHNGAMHIKDTDPIPVDKYCVDFLQMGNDTAQQFTFMCFTNEAAQGFFIYAVGLSISCVFLLATLIVYACLPKVTKECLLGFKLLTISLIQQTAAKPSRQNVGQPRDQLADCLRGIGLHTVRDNVSAEVLPSRWLVTIGHILNGILENR